MTPKQSQAWEWVRQRQKVDERINELFDTIGKLMYLDELLTEYALASHASSEAAAQPPEEPKLDRYPDGGWGMAIDPDKQVTPEEARDIIEAVRKHNEGKHDA